MIGFVFVFFRGSGFVEFGFSLAWLCCAWFLFITVRGNKITGEISGKQYARSCRGCSLLVVQRLFCFSLSDATEETIAFCSLTLKKKKVASTFGGRCCVTGVLATLALLRWVLAAGSSRLRIYRYRLSFSRRFVFFPLSGSWSAFIMGVVTALFHFLWYRHNAKVLGSLGAGGTGHSSLSSSVLSPVLSCSCLGQSMAFDHWLVECLCQQSVGCKRVLRSRRGA